MLENLFILPPPLGLKAAWEDQESITLQCGVALRCPVRAPPEVKGGSKKERSPRRKMRGCPLVPCALRREREREREAVLRDQVSAVEGSTSQRAAVLREKEGGGEGGERASEEGGRRESETAGKYPGRETISSSDFLLFAAVSGRAKGHLNNTPFLSSPARGRWRRTRKGLLSTTHM